MFQKLRRYLKLFKKKSPGLDGIHRQVLSSCDAEELATPLYIIFRKSLDEEYYQRSGNRTECTNI